MVIRGEVKSWNSVLADDAYRAGITEQTEAKMRRDDPQGLNEASSIHCTMGKKGRETIERKQIKQLKKDRQKIDA